MADFSTDELTEMAEQEQRFNLREKIRGLRDETDKFSKGAAYYVNDAFQKPVRCGNCMHFRDGKCNIVSEEGDPNPGVISAQGACSLFNARAPRIQALQLMWGRGEFDGLAPEVARANAFMLTYAALDEEPPEELAEKAFIHPDDIRSGFKNIL